MSAIARKRVAASADRHRIAVDQAAASRKILIATVRNAAIAGVSEYDLADLAGVTRGTIRAWLGK